jgi:hypothetical protein
MMSMAGAMKLARSRDQLLEDPRMGWVEDHDDNTVRLIGGAEVAAGAGLILPWWLGVAEVLTPLAAVGVALIHAGAFLTHRRRGDPQVMAMNTVLFIVAVVLAGVRFGDL